MGLTQSSLVYLGTTTTNTAVAAAITRASMRASAKEISTRVPPDSASATTARPSMTSTATSMEHVGGLTTPGALGVTQLAGATQVVATSSLRAGSQTTHGLTELAHQVVDMEIGSCNKRTTTTTKK